MALAAVVKVVYALAGGGLSQARPCLPESEVGFLEVWRALQAPPSGGPGPSP